MKTKKSDYTEQEKKLMEKCDALMSHYLSLKNALDVYDHNKQFSQELTATTQALEGGKFRNCGLNNVYELLKQTEEAGFVEKDDSQKEYDLEMVFTRKILEYIDWCLNEVREHYENGYLLYKILMLKYATPKNLFPASQDKNGKLSRLEDIVREDGFKLPSRSTLFSLQLQAVNILANLLFGSKNSEITKIFDAYFNLE